MFTSGVRRLINSPSRAVGVIVLIAAVVGLLYVWPDFCVWRADASLQKRQLEAASNWVTRSQWLNASPSAESCLLRLRIARRQQDFPRVETLLKQAIQVGVPDRDLRRERLLAMAQTHQFNEMESQWPELLNDPRDDGPEIARSYYTWAMLHHYPNLAEKTLSLWRDDYPLDAEPLFLLGCFYEAQENWEATENSYRKAYALQPDNENYRLVLARTLQNRLNPIEATPLYAESLRQDPNNVAALQGLAQCEATKGNLDEAIEISYRALMIKPDDFGTLKSHGELLLAAGQAGAATEFLRKAYRICPEHANLANSLARALKESGHNEEATPLFAFVEESRPQLEQLLDLEQKLQQNPSNLNLRMEIASITAKYVSRHDAIRWYENLLLVSPDFRPAHAALTEIYLSLGDNDRARLHSTGMSVNSTPSNPTSAESSTDSSAAPEPNAK